MKIHFQDFFVIINSEREKYFKIMFDILITMWYFITINAERQIYFNNKDEMNFTRKYERI